LCPFLAATIVDSARGPPGHHVPVAQSVGWFFPMADPPPLGNLPHLRRLPSGRPITSHWGSPSRSIPQFFFFFSSTPLHWEQGRPRFFGLFPCIAPALVPHGRPLLWVILPAVVTSGPIPLSGPPDVFLLRNLHCPPRPAPRRPLSPCVVSLSHGPPLVRAPGVKPPESAVFSPRFFPLFFYVSCRWARGPPSFFSAFNARCPSPPPPPRSFRPWPLLVYDSYFVVLYNCPDAFVSTTPSPFVYFLLPELPTLSNLLFPTPAPCLAPANFSSPPPLNFMLSPRFRPLAGGDRTVLQWVPGTTNAISPSHRGPRGHPRPFPSQADPCPPRSLMLGRPLVKIFPGGPHSPVFPILRPFLASRHRRMFGRTTTFGPWKLLIFSCAPERAAWSPTRSQIFLATLPPSANPFLGPISARLERNSFRRNLSGRTRRLPNPLCPPGFHQSFPGVFFFPHQILNCPLIC